MKIELTYSDFETFNEVFVCGANLYWFRGKQSI